MNKSPRPDLDLVINAQQGRTHVPFLREQLRRAHALLSPPLAELSVALLNDARMAELHEQFSGIAGPTDVLTFELDHDARGRRKGGHCYFSATFEHCHF